MLQTVPLSESESPFSLTLPKWIRWSLDTSRSVISPFNEFKHQTFKKMRFVDNLNDFFKKNLLLIFTAKNSRPHINVTYVFFFLH